MYLNFKITDVIERNCAFIGTKSDNALNAMLLGDLHMYGSYRGHWADRIKRESQMRTAFRAAVRQMRPDVIFFLGDSLDEGKWADNSMFGKVTRRFNRYFRDYVLSFNEAMEMFVLTGNHDIGFHYDMSYFKVSFFKMFRNRKSKLQNFQKLNPMLFERSLFWCF